MPKAPAPTPAPEGDLLARALRAPHHRPGIRELSRAAPIGERASVLRVALERGHERAAQALALSLAAERALPADALVELLPDVEDPGLVAFLVGGATGDRLSALGTLFDLEVLTEDAEAMLFWLATERLGLASPLEASWAIRARRLSRRPTNAPDDSAAFLGTALGRLKEDAVVALAAPWMKRVAPLAKVQAKQAAEVLERVDGSLETVLGDEEAPRLLATVTVKSSEPKVGRNDPCPCGSGKKYKKCHGDAEVEPVARANAAIDPATLTAKDLPYVRVAELAALDVEKMKKATLSAALDRATTFRRWALAERCAEILERAHGDATAVRDVALRAIDAGRWDVADRLMDRWKLEELPAELSVHRRMRDLSPQLGELSAWTAEMLADPKSPLFELALSLLHRAPGLGVPVARGLVAELPPEDGDLLAQEIERARDVLALPPGDPALQLIEALDEGDERRAAAETEQKELLAERDGLRATLARKDEEISVRAAEVTSLAMRLEEAEEENAQLAARVADRPVKTEARSSSDEKKKLTARIEELKALVQEGNRERTALRRQITELSEELDARASEGGPAQTEERDDEGQDAPSSPRVPIVPVFSRTARDSLDAFPLRIKKQAIDLSATLAMGEASAWRNVKQMEGVAKVWSARLGIHNRLLFRVHDDQLEVLDVVTREDLLKVLERWR